MSLKKTFIIKEDWATQAEVPYADKLPSETPNAVQGKSYLLDLKAFRQVMTALQIADAVMNGQDPKQYVDTANLSKMDFEKVFSDMWRQVSSRQRLQGK